MSSKYALCPVKDNGWGLSNTYTLHYFDGYGFPACMNGRVYFERVLTYSQRRKSRWLRECRRCWAVLAEHARNGWKA